MVEKNISSDSKPLVSVIINYLNGIEFVHEAIESVINQTYENWEIILYDNASKDNLHTCRLAVSK